MAVIDTDLRVWRITWQGVEGAPGLSTFYSSNDPAVTMDVYLKAFFEGCRTHFPAALTIKYPASYDLVDVTTNAFHATNSITPQADTVGLIGTNYSAPVGALVHWTTSGHTAAIPPKHGTRRVVGTTYLVPLNTDSYTSGGMLSSAALGHFQTAAAGLVTAATNNMYIRTHPKWDASGTRVRDGKASPVFASSVPGKCAVLTSRRD